MWQLRGGPGDLDGMAEEASVAYRPPSVFARRAGPVATRLRGRMLESDEYGELVRARGRLGLQELHTVRVLRVGVGQVPHRTRDWHADLAGGDAEEYGPLWAEPTLLSAHVFYPDHGAPTALGLGTEFVADPLWVRVPPDRAPWLDDDVARRSRPFRTVEAGNGQLVLSTCSTIHRAPRAVRGGWRVFIRISLHPPSCVARLAARVDRRGGTDSPL